MSEVPEFVLDTRGTEVRVGDVIAYASLLSRSATLSVSKVLGFQYGKETDWVTDEPILKIKVQGTEQWNRQRYEKKLGFLRADYKRFVKLEGSHEQA